MEIYIENLHASESLSEASRILFRLSSRKYFLNLIFILIGAILFLAQGIHSLSDIKRSPTNFDDELKSSMIHSISYLYNGLGIGLLFLFLLRLISFIKQRDLYFSEVRAIRNRRANSSNKSIVKITDQSISYQNYEFNQETKWSVYANYLFHGNYLFLFTSTRSWTGISIDLTGVSAGDLNELKSFLRGRLPERKLLRLF